MNDIVSGAQFLSGLSPLSSLPDRPLSKWLCGKPSGMARLSLVCFPYAGGGVGAWLPWRKLLPADVDLYAVQLPGRGARMMEAPLRHMDAMIPHLANATASLGPCVFFGHSMGAFLAYETARMLKSTGRDMPLKLIVSGQRAPHLPDSGRHVHDLPQAEFVEELRSRGGTPDDVLQDKELMELLAPMLRADFELCERYASPLRLPLDIPLTAFGGKQDERAGHAKLDAWKEHTTEVFRHREFEGGHFFVHTAEQAVLAAIWEELA